MAPSHTTWHLADTTSFEDAATLPLAMMTAAIGLFVHLGLDTPSTSSTSVQKKGEVIVINGASSSVGAFATQLATRAGYSVVGIAGQEGAYPKALGAKGVIDYRGKEPTQIVEAVKNAVSSLQGKIVGVYDAVSSEKTVEMLAEIIQPEGGIVTVVLPVGEDLKAKNVKVIRTAVLLQSYFAASLQSH